MKNATEHWEQVKAMWKMRDCPSMSDFQKAYFRPGKKKVAVQRMPYNKEACTAPKMHKWQSTGVEEPTHCVANHMFLKNQQSVKHPMLLKAQAMGLLDEDS